MTGSSKNIQSTTTHKKNQVLWHRFLDEYSFLLPSHHFFFLRVNKISKKLVRWCNFFKKNLGDQKGIEQEMQRLYVGSNFFIFISSLSAIIVTDTDWEI